MSKTILEAGIGRLAFARHATLGFLEDLPDDKLTHAPCPGGNHALWIAGHLCWTDDYFSVTLGGRKSDIPPSWYDVFAMKTTPKPDRKIYPPFAEVRDALVRTRETLIGWLKKMNDAQLAAALPEDFTQFAPTFAALPGAMAWHEGMHAGQLTVIRRSLGIQPKFG